MVMMPITNAPLRHRGSLSPAEGRGDEHIVAYKIDTESEGDGVEASKIAVSNPGTEQRHRVLPKGVECGQGG
jgi:hypothetical protein